MLSKLRKYVRKLNLSIGLGHSLPLSMTLTLHILHASRDHLLALVAILNKDVVVVVVVKGEVSRKFAVISKSKNVCLSAETTN